MKAVRTLLDISMVIPFKARLRNTPAAIGRWLKHLVRELAPKVLFFFGAFLLLFLLFKLFVAQYSIEFSVFTKAAVAALILGKVIALSDRARLGHRLETRRRIVVIVGKTLIYALAVIVFGIGERIVKAVHREGALIAGIDYIVANANMQRFLGLVLLISIVVGSYLLFQEVDRAMGEGALFRLLFEEPGRKKG